MRYFKNRDGCDPFLTGIETSVKRNEIIDEYERFEADFSGLINFQKDLIKYKRR